MKPRILVVDDERRMVEVIAMVLRREGYDVTPEVDAEKALGLHAAEPFDLLITDLRMPGPDGLEVLRRAREIEPDLRVILITAHGTVATAVKALREGAFDYVEKPFDNDELKALVRRALALDRLARENRYLRSELKSRYAVDRIVAESESMRDLLALARRAARSPSTVLITGETGTGKELLARSVHFESGRVGGPFLAVNCRAFAESLLESELFGHEKGAFTGAERARAGIFERADHGTVFLDEIGDISADFQAKLLRVLQEKTLCRVGGDEAREVDVRIVAATNRDLKEEVAAGRFREDLYFRLAVIPMSIPALRERPDDVLPLAAHFLTTWSERLERRVTGWSDEVEAYLRGHAWPGNVRELENTIERGVVLARGERLEFDDLLVEAVGFKSMTASSADAEPAEPLPLHDFLERAAADRIRSALAECGGKRVETARALGIDRTTLYRLIRKYEIE